VEFAVTVAMVGIVLAATVPPFHAMLEGNRHRGSVSQMTSRMYLVRQFAVRDGAALAPQGP
jgi:Tfp pilus assembly protein FimT